MGTTTTGEGEEDRRAGSIRTSWGRTLGTGWGGSSSATTTSPWTGGGSTGG